VRSSRRRPVADAVHFRLSTTAHTVIREFDQIDIDKYLEMPSSRHVPRLDTAHSSASRFVQRSTDDTLALR